MPGRSPDPPPTAARWTVRRALPQDAATVAALVNEAYRVEDFFINGNRTTVEEVRGLIEQDAFLVAETPETGVGGAVQLEIRGGRGYFGMLSVAPEAQGAGLGKRLIATVEEHCRRQGCSHLDLTVVNLRNELRPWYRKLGFSECGTAPFPDPWKLTRPCHMVLMEKALS